MERVPRKPAWRVLGVALILSICAVLPATASAQIDFGPCSNNDLACARLSVPLSPSGAAPGTLQLAIRRRRAPVGEAHSAVIALAGGPGQAAIPFAETFTEVLGPVLDTRDLIVFDQRGTGLSGALKCPAFNAQSSAGAQVVKRCAEQIGASHGFYTTEESVADIEAIRVAGGYEKLVLYGTSYGTKVALEYAEEHPSHVEALVLDSVVAPEGPNPLELSTFAAVPRVLWELCAFHGCAHVTRNPVRDLARLVSRMGAKGLAAKVYDGRGLPHKIRIGSNALLGALVAGDLDPVLRAEFPAAIRAGEEGDLALLGRLILHASVGEEEEPEQGKDPAFDTPLYFATMCEEEAFPWSRSATPSQRLAEARRKIDSLPAGAFAPFTRADVLPFSDMPECAAWPFTRPAPPLVSDPLPAVPTLIISGAEDLRTPTSGARAVAARIPGSHLVVVPNAGHSVLTTEPGACAMEALRALFAKGPIRNCNRTAPPTYLRPTPLAPRRLAKVKPAHGYQGRVGRTLGAVALTLNDMVRELSIEIGEAGGLEGAHATLRSGGLRGGWAALSTRRLRLHRYTYVPGVSLSGWIGLEHLQLRVGGAAGADGTLHRTQGGDLVGELGGIPIRISDKRLLGHGSKGASLAQAARVDAGELPKALGSRLASSPGGRTLIQLLALDSSLQGGGSTSAIAALAYVMSHLDNHDAGLR